MNNLSPTSQFDRPRPPLGVAFIWPVRVLSLVAACLSAYLVVLSNQHGDALGCSMGGAFDCDAVLSSSWSKILNVPVAALGAGCYAAIFLVSWFVGVRNASLARWALGVLVLLTVTAAGGALWFIGIQHFQIGAYCLYCLLVHTCGLTMAVLLAIGLGISCSAAREDARSVVHLRSALVAGAQRPRQVAPASPISGPSQFALPVAAGLLFIVAIVAAQWLFPAPTNEVAQAGDLGGQVNLDEPLTNNGESDSISNEGSPNAHIVRRPLTESNDDSVENNAASQDVFANDEGNAPPDDDQPALNDDADDEDGFAATGEFDNDPFEFGEVNPTESPNQFNTSADQPPSRMVSVYNNQIKFDIYKQPYLGSPEAPHVVVELFDYTCKHCRKMHDMLQRVRRRYGDQLAFVVMPVPMEASCNPRIRHAAIQHRGSCKLARLALAAAAARPTSFERYHYWLIDDDDSAPSYGRALVQAYNEFGRTDIRQELESESIDQRIQRNISLYFSLASRWEGEKALGLPVLILGDKISSGSVEFEDELFKLFESNLIIEPTR